MIRINVLCHHNGVGLSRHLEILRQALNGSRYQVTQTTRTWAPARTRLGRTLRRQTHDINLFIEHIRPEWLPTAPINCLIPNQEWFMPEDQALLHGIDCVLCATRAAERAFAERGARTELVSFTSRDRLRKDVPRSQERVLHLAGLSMQKGTRVVVEAWRRHPEWPMLFVIQHPTLRQTLDVPNIEYVAEYVSDARLRWEQNRCSLHLCPSEVEGFGHTMVEGMSCHALIVTTDGPPMNEMVSPERGLLVSAGVRVPQHFGVNHYVEPAALERGVDEALGMGLEARQRLGRAAREWYEENDRFFRRRLREVIDGL